MDQIDPKHLLIQSLEFRRHHVRRLFLKLFEWNTEICFFSKGVLAVRISDERIDQLVKMQ